MYAVVYLKSTLALPAVASTSEQDYMTRLFKDHSGGMSTEPFASVTSHVAHVRCIAFNHLARVGVSIDEKRYDRVLEGKRRCLSKRNVKFRFVSKQIYLTLSLQKPNHTV